jgi:uncharacterized protein
MGQTEISPRGVPARVGSVVALWRYPVKSMMGEEVDASYVAEGGLLGDRTLGLVDQATGKVASAKNPKKWGKLFDFRASFVDPPSFGEPLPDVRIDLPQGGFVMAGHPGTDGALSRALGAQVKVMKPMLEKPSLEEYWPDIEGRSRRDEVTDELMPAKTFFDAAPVHLVTTATLGRLRELCPKGRFEARRFRPNIVVEAAPDAEGFVENGWVARTLRIGEEVRLRVTGACSRCVMTTLPQGDLPNDLDILRTALAHNKSRVGVYASVERAGSIKRDDSVWLE